MNVLVLGNCWTFVFSKTKTCGLLDLKETSPERISNKDASSVCNFNLEGLNLPFGSAKKDLSNNEPSPPVSIIIFLFNFIKSFFFIVPLSNLDNNFFVDVVNFASPGIGFLITLFVFIKLISLSA